MATTGLEIITGVMGSGKTYMGVEQILQALNEGAQVHTNIELNKEICDSKGWSDNIVMLPENVKKMKDCIRAGHEDLPNILVLDEAQMSFYVDDQREMSKKEENREVMKFLAWSRRYGLQIYFIAQSEKNIDIKLRRMATQFTRCTNMRKIPYFAWLLAPIFGDFKRTLFVLENEDKPLKVGTSYCRFNKNVGNLYDTHSLSLMGKDAQINKLATRKRMARHDQTVGKLMVFAVICVVAATFLYGRFMWNAVFHKNDQSQLAQQQKPHHYKNKSNHKITTLIKRPTLKAIDQAGNVYAKGLTVNNKKILTIDKYGVILIITYDDHTTQSLELLPIQPIKQLTKI